MKIGFLSFYYFVNSNGVVGTKMMIISYKNHLTTQFLLLLRHMFYNKKKNFFYHCYSQEQNRTT